MKLQTITGLVAGLATAHLASAADLFAFEAAHALVSPNPGHHGALRASAVKLGALKSRDGVIEYRDNVLVARQGTCEIGYKRCDDGCIPLTYCCPDFFFTQSSCVRNWVCCNDGDGAYCRAATYCTTLGCCPVGELCSGAPGECEAGTEECGSGCMPLGATCCSNGYHCDAGETCTVNGCEPGSGGGGGGGGGGSGGGVTCDSDEDKCDNSCIPAGSVCCGDGDGAYCKADWVCTLTGCRPEDAVDCGDGSYCDAGTLCDNVRDVCVDPSLSISASRTSTSTRSFTFPTSTESEASVPTFPTLPRPSDPADDNDDEDNNDDGGVGGSSTEETTASEQDPPAETGGTSAGGGGGGDSNGAGKVEGWMSLPKVLGLAAMVPLFL